MESRFFDGLAVVVFAVLGALIIFTFQDYGLSWDGRLQLEYGEMILRFFHSGFADTKAATYENMPLYGGLFDAVVQSLTRILPFSIVDTRHLFTALTGFLACVGAWRFARYLGGSLAGFLTILFLVALPSFYGHSFINPKDIPFAAGYIWTLYFIARAGETLPIIPFRRAFPVGLALGLTLGVRVGGALLIIYMGLLFLLHFVWTKGRVALLEEDRQDAKTVIRSTIKTVFVVFVPAYFLMIVLWPMALLSPVLGPFQALMETVRFKFNTTILFKGDYVYSINLPSDYIPTYFGVKLPEYLLVVLAITLLMAAHSLWCAFRDGNRQQFFGYAAIGLGAFFPPIFSIVTKAVHYDAIRHFLFIIPPLVVLAGVEAKRASVWLHAWRPAALAAAGVLLSVGIACTGWAMVRLHPYQYIYYNAMAGGLSGAAGRYELDYWATSYKEVAGKLIAYVIEDVKVNKIPAGKRSFWVFVCGPAFTALHFLPTDFKLTREISQADFYISFTRWSCDRDIEAPVVVEVKRQDTRIAVAKDLRRGYQTNK